MADFPVSQDEILGWIEGLEPGVEIVPGLGRGIPSFDSTAKETNFFVVTSEASSDNVLAHIQTLLRKRLSSRGWAIDATGDGAGHFTYHASKGATRFHVHCWLIPIPEEDYYLNQKQSEGKTATHIRFLYTGFHTR